MTPNKTLATTRPGLPPAAPTFTVARANQALVLVRKIVADIVARHDDLVERRRERDHLLEASAEPERLQELNDHIARCVADLDGFNRELLAIGGILKDWRSGLVDFPAMHRDRRIWLCWRLGESAVTHWHELHEGAAGRRPINGEDFA